MTPLDVARSGVGLRVAAAASLMLCLMMLSGRARAYGGLWSSDAEAIRLSAEKILFVDNPESGLTVILEVQFQGTASEFAWLIPVSGEPQVGASSHTVFERLDAVTSPQYWVARAQQVACKPSNDVGGPPASDPNYDATPANTPDGAATAVVVLNEGTAGPYDFSTIEMDPSLDDPVEAATAWLTQRGYDLTGVESEVLRPYLSDGLNLLAVRLRAGMDASSIRPLTLTYASERPTIAVKPMAVAAQDDISMLVWVFGPSQAIPENYASLVINDALVDWLSGRTYPAGTLPAGGAGTFGVPVPKPSNYDAVVAAAVREAGGQAFVTELGQPASQFRDRVWSPLDDGNFASLTDETYADGLDAVLAASSLYGGWDGFTEAVQGAVTLPNDATFAEFASDPESFRGSIDVDASKFFELLNEQVVKPVADAAALLHNAPYVTRLYTTLSPDALTVDPTFSYNADLAQISNVHVAEQFIDCDPGSDREDAAWRIELPQGGVVVGSGDDPWPVEVGSLPANLKVVMLSESGSGSVLEDNSEEIGRALFESAGMTPTDSAFLSPPQNGLLIGGSQTVRQYVPEDVADSPPHASSGQRCSVAYAGARARPTLAGCLALLAMVFGRRRRAKLRAIRAASVAHRSAAVRSIGWVLGAALVPGCTGSGGSPADAGPDALEVGEGALTLEQLRDPETCKDCHPAHYREWSGSMHAYAAQDPVFLAMNRRGQRETKGALGDFCIKCHAPMAVVDKLSKDGLNLERLPDFARGVSCYFCHNVVGIDGDHNGMLRVADDDSMRGPIEDPLEPRAHRVEYSEIFDRDSPQSSAMCGGCHDVVTQSGVHLERTYQEYLNGIFSKSATGEPPSFDSCVGCHMRPREAPAAVVPAGGKLRTVHEHLWPAVDLPLTPFPHSDALRSAVEDCELSALSVAFFTLEVTPPDLFTFQIETGAGHNQPSGSAQDRRLWLEFLAYDEGGELLEQVSSGNIADGEIEEKPTDDPQHDPHLLLFRERIYDAQGEPVHMFWDAAKSEAFPEGFASNLLPSATTTYVEGRHAVVKQYRARGPSGPVARVTARLRLRPVGVDVLQDLVDSGDLDPKIMAQMQTLTFGAQIEWTPADGWMTPIRAEVTSDCSTYRCLLDPSSHDCP